MTGANALRPLVRIAWRNVGRHWRHSLGAALSIVVGFVAIGLFEGYLHDLEVIQRDWYIHRGMLGHVVIEQRGASGREGREDPWRFSLHGREQAFIDGYLRTHSSQVATRVRVLQLGGLATTGRAGVMFYAWGVDVREAAALRGEWAWNVTAGRPLHEGQENAVIIGTGLGSLLDCTGPAPAGAIGPDGKPKKVVRPLSCRQNFVQLSSTTEHGQLNVIDPSIVGLFDAGLKDVDTRFAQLPLPLAQQLADTESVTFYAVLLEDESQSPAFIEGLRQSAAQSGLELDIAAWVDHPFAELYRRTDSILAVYRNLVVLIVVTIAGMSVLTTMLKSVNERIREIGTLRSLGFRRRHILVLFSAESALLALGSSLVGFLATVAIARLINGANLSYDGGVATTPIPLTVSVVPAACVFAVAFLSGVAVLAALLPARRASRLGIPDALGHV
ncbi:MAG: ABC transporter permease [Vicinamibacterales bacterium]